MSAPYRLQYREHLNAKWKNTGLAVKSPALLRTQLRDYAAQLAEDKQINYAAIELRIVTSTGMEIHRLDRDGDHYGRDPWASHTLTPLVLVDSE